MVRDEYALSVAYMRLDVPAESLILKKELWTAAQSNYIASHREGGRFYNLNIIERLLPQGYVAASRFLSRGTTEGGAVAPLADLCAQSDSDVAIVGDGGIGKTTFLQHLMEEEFLAPDGSARRHMRNRPVPFFIELNRCPDHIRNWYDSALGKTNFITRYIGQIWEGMSTKDSGSQMDILSLNSRVSLNASSSPLMVTPSPRMSSPCAFSFRRSSMICSSKNSIIKIPLSKTQLIDL